MPESLRLHRWGVAGGIAFALLVIVWSLLTHVPAAVDAPDHILDVYAEPSVRAQAFAGTLVLAVATLCFIGFLADLVTLLRKADGSDGPLPTIALCSGMGFLALTLAAGTMFVVLPNLIAFDEVSAQVDPDIASVTVQVGYLLFRLRHSRRERAGARDLGRRAACPPGSPMVGSCRLPAVRPAPSGFLRAPALAPLAVDRRHQHRASPAHLTRGAWKHATAADGPASGSPVRRQTSPFRHGRPNRGSGWPQRTLSAATKPGSTDELRGAG
jgi:hypothetical protein